MVSNFFNDRAFAFCLFIPTPSSSSLVSNEHGIGYEFT